MLRHREQAQLRATVEGLVKTIAPGRPHPHHVQPDGRGDRPAVVDRPQPAEHPGAHRRGPGDPPRLRRRRGVRVAADRRLQPDRAAGDGAPVRGRGPARGVHLGRGPAHHGRLAGLRGRPRTRSTPRCAARSRRCRTAWPTACPRSGSPSSWASSADEARALMDTYFERFGGVRDYLHRVVEEARVTGYTETLLGRRRYLPDLNSDNRQRREMAERMALNAPIQGSAADIVKIAMLRVDAALTEAGARLADAAPGARRNRAGGRPRRAEPVEELVRARDVHRLSAARAAGRVGGRRARTGSRRRTDRSGRPGRSGRSGRTDRPGRTGRAAPMGRHAGRARRARTAPA